MRLSYLFVLVFVILTPACMTVNPYGSYSATTNRTTNAEFMARWNQLKKGMTMEEVFALVPEARSVASISALKGLASGRELTVKSQVGSLVFSADSDRTLVSWSLN